MVKLSGKSWERWCRSVTEAVSFLKVVESIVLLPTELRNLKEIFLVWGKTDSVTDSSAA